MDKGDFFYAMYLNYENDHDDHSWGVELAKHPGPPLVMILPPHKAEEYHELIASTVATHAMYGAEWDHARFRDWEADSYWLPEEAGDDLVRAIEGWVYYDYNH